MLRPCQLLELGQVPYQTAWDWQRKLVEARILDRSRPDLLLLLEHPAVYTLGQGADLSFVHFQPGEYELHRVERGGEVTFHGPGQLVGYPILDLQNHRKDLHWYLRQLEEVLLLTLEQLDIPAERISGLTGVWSGGRKLGAIGIKVSRWVTMHGFSLNVNPNLNAFSQIIPCGLEHPVASIAEFYTDIQVGDVQPLLIAAFAQVFNRQLIPGNVFDWL
ncbi:MAG: lipoyl(octanoyl) transferase LipB [Anaerolineae bacterium]|nr:lipoyl(octanoyl) transferase LipB [Gloeobacterales cyanobacterium ES-bin-313]